MLVSTMNDSEKRKQAIEDTAEINKYVKYDLYKKLHRDIKKFNNFPRIFKTVYVTKNRNKYYLLFRAESKNQFDKGFWVHAYTIMDSNEGKYAMIAVSIVDNVESFQIYAPHLFARYTQRYGVKMYEEDRIHKFMEDSTEVRYGGVKVYDKENGKIMSIVKGGAIFGDIDGDIIVFKTFVDEDRLYDNQIDIGDEIIDGFILRDKLYKAGVRKKK